MKEERHEHRQGFQSLRALWTYYRGWKWLLFLGMTLALFLSSYLVLIAKTTDVSTLQEALKTQTVIYGSDDQEAGKLTSQKGAYINLEDISQPMRETLIATEDRRFYEHKGFDTLGIGRAFVRLLINRNASGGGGSTLTQQLAKNAFLSADQTLQRKLKELFLAIEIEKVYSKDQILEMYLNHAFFGNGVWGIENASQKYFGHSASHLDWDEAAVLTGILKGPSLFNPIDDYDAAMDRRNLILDLLADQEVLSPEETEAYQSYPINLLDNYYAEDDYRYPSYFDAVINEAIAMADIPEDDLLGKGYKIYTNLDVGYQEALDQAYANDWMFPADDPESPLVQSASVVVNPKNGGVAAVYGGRGEYTYRGFNRATDMLRSPGSTIKPLDVYTPALEAGYTIQSSVPDIVQAYGSENYAPENYDRQTDPSGQVPLYYALAQSKNTSAVYLMDQLGIDKAVHKLKQFGLSIPKEDQHLTMALGALSRGVTVKDMASAYAAFANQGVRSDSYFIRRIEDANGKVVYDNENPHKHKVMTTNVAADMTSMMLETYGSQGTAMGAGPDYGQLAGKTGSTEVSDGNMQTRDKWMIGYTPDFVLASWVGLDQEAEGTSLDTLMPTGMGGLFNQLTTQVMAQSPQTPFEVLPASQMTQASNDMPDNSLQDTTSRWLDQASDWLQNEGPGWVEQAKEAGQKMIEAADQWFQSLDLSF